MGYCLGYLQLILESNECWLICASDPASCTCSWEAEDDDPSHTRGKLSWGSGSWLQLGIALAVVGIWGMDMLIMHLVFLPLLLSLCLCLSMPKLIFFQTGDEHILEWC